MYPGKVSPAAFEKICDHLIKDYFLHPSYWKIDGKPYFSFYDLSKLLENFGSVEATRVGLDKFRAKVKAAGPSMGTGAGAGEGGGASGSAPFPARGGPSNSMASSANPPSTGGGGMGAPPASASTAAPCPWSVSSAAVLRMSAMRAAWAWGSIPVAGL